MNEDKLFDLIKQKKFDDIINIIKSNDNINLNIQDNTGIYFIHYIILYNNPDLLALVLSKNINIDILDLEGKTILYNPIKFNYIDIVKLLLYFNNTIIGIPLLDILDKDNNNAIYYCIKFNNIDVFNEIIKLKFNINNKDKNRNNILHLTIKNNNTYMTEKLLERNININQINIDGETPIYYAINNNSINIVKLLISYNCDIEIKNNKYQMTPLLYASYLNLNDIIIYIYENGGNVNDQDIFGNTILHYMIKHKNLELYNYFLEKTNVNLININGYNILGSLLNSPIDSSKYKLYNIEYLLKNSRVNDQDTKGETIIFKLVELDLWEDYYDILKNKKINIFINNNNNITIYDLIKKSNKYDKFMNMISMIYYNKLSDLEKTKFTDKKNNINYKKIIDLIINKKISYPYNDNITYCNNKNISFVSFTGSHIDIICGIIYLKSIHNNLMFTTNNNFVNNDNIINYYKSIGILKNNKKEFFNFEILWLYQNLFFPTTMTSNIKTFKKSDKQYLIIPIGIELYNGLHANIILYDKVTNEMERFEPYGKDYPHNYNYNNKKLDDLLHKYFLNYFENMKYYAPLDYQNKLGPQLLDTNEMKNNVNIGDPGGFCAAWCLWYIDIRLKYPEIDRSIIIQKIINKIKLKNIALRQIIRNFTKNVTDIRDGILTKVNIDINNWINNTFNDNQFNEIIKIINNHFL